MRCRGFRLNLLGPFEATGYQYEMLLIQSLEAVSHFLQPSKIKFMQEYARYPYGNINVHTRCRSHRSFPGESDKRGDMVPLFLRPNYEVDPNMTI